MQVRRLLRVSPASWISESKGGFYVFKSYYYRLSMRLLIHQTRKAFIDSIADTKEIWSKFQDAGFRSDAAFKRNQSFKVDWKMNFHWQPTGSDLSSHGCAETSQRRRDLKLRFSRWLPFNCAGNQIVSDSIESGATGIYEMQDKD